MARPEIRLDLSGMERLLRQQPERSARWLDAVAEDIVSDVKLSMGTSPPGRAYPRGNTVHVASQPGYPPNVDTGNLRASIGWRRLAPLDREVRDGVDYGAGLEFGHGRVAARPFMRPVFVAWRLKIGRDARRRLNLV